MESLISVIIPIYNSELYLGQCLESIINQTYKNIEIICVNDGSTDQSNNIINDYKKKDERIKSIYINNSGVSAARNMGLNYAKGEYIIFIDSDDYVAQNYINSLYENMLKHESEISICGIQNFGSINSLNQLSFEIIFLSNAYIKDWYDLNTTFLLYGPCNKMYKKSIINKNNLKFDKTIVYGEDLIFNFSYLNYVKKISYTKETQYYYRKDTYSSLSKVYRKDRFNNELKMFNTMKLFMMKHNLYDDIMRIYLNDRLFDCAYNCIFDIAVNVHKNQQYFYIFDILHNIELSDCYRRGLTLKYSKIIIFMMRHKLCRILKIWLNIRLKTN